MHSKQLLTPEEINPPVALDSLVVEPLSEELKLLPLTEESKTPISAPGEIVLPQNASGGVLAIASLFAALLAVSLAAIFICWSEEYIGPNATIFNRLWIATLVFALWNGFDAARLRLSSGKSVERSPYTSKDLALLVAVGIVSSTSLGFWAWSLTQTNVANSTVLRNLTPLFTTLGGWLLLGRNFEGKFLIGLAIAMGGAIAMGIGDFHIAANSLLGDIAALLAALFYAGNLLLSEQLRMKFPATTILMWRCLIGSGLILPLVLLTENQVFPSSWQGWLAVIGLGVICQAFGQGLLIHSLGQLSSSFVAVFLLLEPIITAILAWAIFGESLSPLNWLAFAVVLVGIYLAKSSPSVDKKSS